MSFDREICLRCKCCELVFEACDQCGGDGVDGHDCGEDVCCCLDPDENVDCDVCGGEGGWWICLGRCNEDGQHEAAK